MIHTTVYHPRSGELVGGGVQRSETVVNMPIREGTFFIGGGGWAGVFKNFLAKKVVALPLPETD